MLVQCMIGGAAQNIELWNVYGDFTVKFNSDGLTINNTLYETETVKKGDNSNKYIIIVPDEGYLISKVTIKSLELINFSIAISSFSILLYISALVGTKFRYLAITEFSSAVSLRVVRRTLLMVSTMWTGIRIVRA